MERRDKCMQRRRQKGQRHGGLKGKHVCDAYRRRVFFHKACNNGGRRQLAEIHDSRISPSRSPRVLLRLRWFRRSPFINKHAISFSKIFSFQRKIFLRFFRRLSWRIFSSSDIRCICTFQHCILSFQFFRM